MALRLHGTPSDEVLHRVLHLPGLLRCWHPLGDLLRGQGDGDSLVGLPRVLDGVLQDAVQVD